MAVKRRRAASKRVRRPEPSRVAKITSSAAWQKLKMKHADNLIIVHFSGAFSPQSTQLRPYFAMYAKLPQYSHVTFVEIDVNQVSDVAESIDVKGCPTIACWKAGEMVQMSQRGEGGDPSFIRKMLEAHAGDKPSAPRWRTWLLRALLAAGAVSAATIAVRSTRGSDDLSRRAAAIDEQRETLLKSLSVAKRKKQQKIVKQLDKRLNRLRDEARALDELAKQQGRETQLHRAGRTAYSSSDDEQIAAYDAQDSPAGGRLRSSKFSDGSDASGYSSDSS